MLVIQAFAGEVTLSYFLRYELGVLAFPVMTTLFIKISTGHKFTTTSGEPHAGNTGHASKPSAVAGEVIHEGLGWWLPSVAL